MDFAIEIGDTGFDGTNACVDLATSSHGTGVSSASVIVQWNSIFVFFFKRGLLVGSFKVLKIQLQLMCERLHKRGEGGGEEVVQEDEVAIEG